MTVYGHQRPARSGGRPRRGLLTGAVLAAVTASWAFAAMGAVAALGAHLLGLDHYVALGPATAALVALAVGGTVTPSGDLSVFGIQAAGAHGAIGIMPLGVSFVGALVLGGLFVRPLRRLPVLDPSVLLSRLAGTLVGFLLLLWVVAWSGNGTVAIKLNSLTGGSGSGGSGGPLGGLGGLGGLIGGVVGNNTQPTVGFRVEALPTLGLGLLWALVVLALAVLATRRVPLPYGWGPVRRYVRPVVSAVVTVVCAAVLAGAVSGIVVGLSGNGGARTVGGVLLGTPNGVFLAVPLGMAVPLNGKATGPLGRFLPSPVDQLLKGGGGQSITLDRLAQLDGRVWLLPVAVALMLLAAGVFAAVRTPRPVLPLGALREAAWAGLRLGVALAVTVPVLLGLGAVSVNADLSVFGFSAVGAELSISGNLLAGAGLGLLEGAVFGFLGALLVRRFAAGERMPADPPGPGGPAAGPGAPYDALPGRAPSPPPGTGPSGRPHTSPPPVNPYSGRPVQQPPPPPAPPNR